MSTTALATREPAPLDPATVASVLLTGDLEKLNDQQRMSYCTRVCETLGLNPLTQPFAFIRLNGKLVMYAKKDATEQLRKLHGVSITEVTSQRVEDVFVVTAKAQDKTGRTDAATGAVAIGNLKGEPLANGLMKAETKAKRRVTLSICGLGMLDETETETVREPQYTIEAQSVPAAPIPEGAYRILRVVPRQFGGDVTVVNHQGVEETYPVPDSQSVILLEQWGQEQPEPFVTLKLVIGARDKKVKVKEVHRWLSPEEQQAKAENAALDAEIAKQQPEPAL